MKYWKRETYKSDEVWPAGQELEKCNHWAMMSLYYVEAMMSGVSRDDG